MIIKLIGSIILTLSGVGFALSHCRYQRKKLITIDAFISLIRHIKGQIDCYARPINEILATLPPEIYHGCNCSMGAESIEEMIDESKIYLDDEPLRLLRSFSCEFGSTFREEQLRRCDYYISSLGEKRGQIEKESEAKSRSGSALYICGALSLSLLLW
jgi:hypothetical protein